MEREYDEREKQLILKCKSQTLTLVFMEVIVTMFLCMIIPLNYNDYGTLIAFLFALPVVFYRCKMSYYLETSRDIYSGVVICAIAVTITVLSHTEKSVIEYLLFALAWMCLILVSIFKRRHR